MSPAATAQTESISSIHFNGGYVVSKNDLTKAEKAARKKLQRFLCDKIALAGIIAGAICGTVFTVLFLGFATGLIYKLIGFQDSITPDRWTSRFILFFYTCNYQRSRRVY